MSLKSLKIHNYRSVVKAELDLSPGINVIVGQTDEGKSNIYRAIRDCAFNSVGSDFVSAGAESTKVVITTDDDHTITWMKGEKLNQYKVDDEIYNSPGRESPPAVQDTLGFRELRFDKDLVKRLNFCGQFDPAFILGDSHSATAKIIGAVSNIHIVYRAIREGNREEKQLKQDLKSNRDRARELKEIFDELKEFPFVERRKSIDDLCTKIKHIRELNRKLETVGKLSQKLSGLRDQKRKSLLLSKSYGQLSKLDIKGLIEKVEKVKNIKKAAKSLRAALRLKKDSGSIISSFEKLSMINIGDVGDKIEKLESLKKLQKRLKTSEKRKHMIDVTLSAINTKLKQELKKLDKISKEMTICPLSNIKLFDECREQLFERSK